MQHSFSYEKKKVIQALRYHFVQRIEIRILIILVNVFAIIAAVLFYTQKIRPEPFLLGSFVWLMLMATFWYFLPQSIYKKSATFRDSFIIDFTEEGIRLENERGFTNWSWQTFTRFFESPHFFHLYFDARSFFLIPKENMGEAFRHELRGMLGRKIIKN
ncbi:MAG: YcxB family protein [Chitinophagaceae bacterium]|nr:YcxB family protein [Chitinophagaceae bacterium]MDP1762643.1 YcxB family protein [Sediminibacterium sp.]MDP1810089.1 YcxB family protein [Sediminibacterium sp.]MDP3127795.1 YcxB family protein [Sediminibacterium sp.]MDP3667064.1 YcxB family protein [Sediminibacterium sp.]